MRKTAFAFCIMILFSSSAYAYDCWSWGEPAYCGEFSPSLRAIAEDVKKCMSENHLNLYLPQLVILKAQRFDCDGVQAVGCTLFPDWIIIASGWGYQNEFKILRHELVHYILWVTGHPTENASHEDWQFFSEKCINRTTSYEQEMIEQQEEAAKAKSREVPSPPLSPETPSSPETTEEFPPKSSIPKSTIYKWVDKNGIMHMTNDITSIPQEYKDKLIK